VELSFDASLMASSSPVFLTSALSKRATLGILNGRDSHVERLGTRVAQIIVSQAVANIPSLKVLFNSISAPIVVISSYRVAVSARHPDVSELFCEYIVDEPSQIPNPIWVGFESQHRMIE
jgi:hypothetical protein